MVSGVCDTQLGYYALTVCILNKNYTPERAFRELTLEIEKITGLRKDITDADVEDMVKLKETMTYQQIGELYGLKADATYSRIRSYKRKCQRRAMQ